MALGSHTMVGMGGAGAANVIGTAGVLLNPSAIGVRPTTDLDEWSIDYHLDFLTGTLSSDYDNNGQVASGGMSMVTAGIGGRYHDWAVAFTGTARAVPVTGSDLHAQTLGARVTLARWIPELDLAVGGGVQSAAFDLAPKTGPSLFSVSGVGL